MLTHLISAILAAASKNQRKDAKPRRRKESVRDFSIFFASPRLCVFALILIFASGRLVGKDQACDLSSIYTDEFHYSFPKEMLAAYLDGRGFDHKESYSTEERRALEEDIEILYHKILSTQPLKQLHIDITAGAPGSGKTTLLEQDLCGKNIAYIDPDAVCLKQMWKTYQKELEVGLDEVRTKSFDSEAERLAAEREVRQALYDKWRPGSNAAYHLILANLLRQNYAVYIGSTSTSPFTFVSFEFFRQRGYEIRILHLTAPDKVRWESVLERDKHFVQTTEEDIREKGNLFPQRLRDTYLKYAYKIDFYYRDAVAQDAVLCGSWQRERGEEVAVVVEEGYEKIRGIHDQICGRLNEEELPKDRGLGQQVRREDLLWDQVLPIRSF